MSIARPAAAEHAPFALTYINATSDALAAAGHDDVVALLAAQPGQLHALLDSAAASQVDFAYAPGKWTLGESLVHVTDTERVFAYRLMRIARGDTTPLPGFDQDAWVPVSGARGRSLADILTEFDAVRAATLALVRTLSPEALANIGTASGHPVSARALVWMLAGHAAHHVELTRTHYLNA